MAWSSVQLAPATGPALEMTASPVPSTGVTPWMKNVPAADSTPSTAATRSTSSSGSSSGSLSVRSPKASWPRTVKSVPDTMSSESWSKLDRSESATTKEATTKPTPITTVEVVRANRILLASRDLRARRNMAEPSLRNGR